MLREYGDFFVDTKRLDAVVQTVYSYAKQGRGFYSYDYKKRLPQYNLPQNLDDREKALFTFTRAGYDRLEISYRMQRRFIEFWQRCPQDRWFFYPEQVVEKQDEQIHAVMNHYLKITLDKDKRGEIHRSRAKLLLEKYDGDPRQIFNDTAVDESITRLHEFRGIKTGIAPLILCELYDLNLIRPLDPDRLLGKQDRHKQRLMVNTNAVIPKEGVTAIYHEPLAKALMHELRESSQRLGLLAAEIDYFNWLIGEMGCSKKDELVCYFNCPLYKTFCEANCSVGTYQRDQIRGGRGANGKLEIKVGEKRIDTRRRLPSMLVRPDLDVVLTKIEQQTRAMYTKPKQLTLF